MTLKGKKNHYNIKILRGYGVSINLKGNKVVLTNGQNDITGRSDKEEWFVTKIPYEKIVISGKGYVSTEAIKLLSEKNINVLLTDTYGHPHAFMNNVMSSSTATRYRMAQYDAFRDPEKVQYLRRWILDSKLESQINFLKSLHNPELEKGISQLEQYRKSVPNLKEYRDFLTLESRCGNIYFNNYAKLFDPKYKFDSRHGGGLVLKNRYAGDIINALLNYGYSVLAGEICKFVNALGLDAYYGFITSLIFPFRRWCMMLSSLFDGL